MYLVDLQNGTRRAFGPEGVAGTFVAVSPDGKRVALDDSQGGILVQPLEGGEARTYPNFETGPRQPFPLNYTPDGKRLFVLGRAGAQADIYLLDLATGKWTLWKQLSSSERLGVLDYGPVQVTPDGKSYVYSYRQMLSTLFLVSGLGESGT
jgi:Tol biopolymer transport system component